MPKRVVGGLVGLAILWVLLTPAIDTSNAHGQGLGAPLTSSEQRVVDLVNVERAKAGLATLSVSSELADSAREYAEYMASANFFAHEGPDGSTLATRNQAAGYTQWTWLGENLAAGQSTPEGAMIGWMASPGHRANIIASNPTEIGVGYAGGGKYGHYWVQEFGARAGARRVAQLSIVSDVWTSPITGHTIAGQWLTQYKAMGGLDNLGHPRSGQIADSLAGGRTAQYFQRAVLELHPENPEAYRIQRRLLADVLHPGADPPIDPSAAPPGPFLYFPPSSGPPTGLGHFVADFVRSGQAVYFKDYFDKHGGVHAFGFPKEEPKIRNGLWTQRFQAAVFEYHPENDRDGLVSGTNIPLRNYRVQLELLGDKYIAMNGLPYR